MALPSKWKVNREFRRLKRQIWERYSVLTDPLTGAIWTRMRPRLLKVTPGVLPLGKDLAIFLVFQPKGCPASCFATLRALVAQGFTPVVVSNLKLSPQDREALQQVSWRVIERPNLGYDFGGYRDGLWYCQNHAPEMDSLLFLNDTIWFPAVSGDTTLRWFRENPADYVALADTLYFGAKGMKTRPSDRVRTYHFASFCFQVRRAILESPDFRAYWQEFKLSSRKQTVILRGEVGHYQMLADGGFSTDCLIRRLEIMDQLVGMDAAELREVYRALILVNPVHARVWEQTDLRMTQGELGIEDLRAFLLMAADAVNTADFFAYYGLRHLSFPMLKKTILKNKEVRAKFMALVAAQDPGLDPQVLAELRAMDG